MKRFVMAAFCAAALLAGCSHVSTTQVGDKDVVQVSEMGIQFFNKGGAPVSKCVEALGANGATTVIEANGPATEGLFGIMRSIGTSGTDVCRAVGSK